MKRDKNKKSEKTDKEKTLEGIALALAFLSASLVLYFSPTYLEYKAITYIICILFGIIGIIGLVLELNKLSSKPKGFGLDNLGNRHSISIIVDFSL